VSRRTEKIYLRHETDWSTQSCAVKPKGMHWRTYKALWAMAQGGLPLDSPFDLAQSIEVTNRALADLGLLRRHGGGNAHLLR
jgi:hypothetical protein